MSALWLSKTKTWDRRGSITKDSWKKSFQFVQDSKRGSENSLNNSIDQFLTLQNES